MKKRLLSAFLAIVIALSCFGIAASAVNETLYAKDYLEYYVPIKEKTTFSSGTADKADFKFDSSGRLIKRFTRVDYQNANAWAKTAYTYNSKGNLTQYLYKRNYGSGNYTKTYKYDSNEKLTKIIEKSLDNGNKSTDLYKYDSKGRLIKKHETTPNKESSKDYVYSYNSKGLRSKVEKTTFWSGSGSKDKSTTSYKYNSKGRVSEIRTVYNITGYVEKFNYKYDSNGNMIKITKRTSSGLDYVTTKKYDKADRLVKEYTEKKGGSTEQTVYSYNSKGMLVKETQKSSYGENISISYKYDSKGNNIETVRKDKTNNSSSTSKVKYSKLSKPACETKYGIRLSKYQYKYNGSARKPVVTVENGFSFKSVDYKFKHIDYKLSYSNNVKPGNAKVKVRFINPDEPEFFGRTVTIVFKILPA